MKILGRLLLFCVMLLVSGCGGQAAPSSTKSVSLSPEIPTSSSPTPIHKTPIPTAVLPTSTPTVEPTSTADITSSPTVFAYTPGPSPLPPDLSRLQVINRTNIKDLEPVWRRDPPFPVTVEYGEMTLPVFSPDSQQILFLMNLEPYRMEISTGQILQSYTLDGLFAKEKDIQITWAIFSPDGEKVAGLTTEGQGPVLWDMATGKPIWKADWRSDDHSHGGDTYCDMTFSPDGKYLVTTSIHAYGDVRVWSAETGKLIQPFHYGNQVGVEFSRDGKRLFTFDRGQGYYGIHIWDTSTWAHVDDILAEVYPYRFSITKNGEIAVIKAGNGVDASKAIEIFRMRDWKRLGDYTERDSPDALSNTINAGPALNLDGGIIAFSPGDFIGTSGLKIKFLDTMSQEKIFTLDCDLPMPIQGIDFSPDGKLLMVQAENGTTVFYGIKA